MVECDYCGDSFGDEESYRTHLRDEHADDLGPIDRRRVGILDDDGGKRVETGPLLLGVVLLVAVAAIGGAALLSNGPFGSTGATHIHGAIAMTIDGNQVDLGPGGTSAFHIHSNDEGRWHVEATDVTLEQGLNELGVSVTDSTVTYQGTTYRASDPNTTVTITVNGNRVTPNEYVPQRGDRIRIVVRSE